jgi:hypothetical protein
MDIPKTLRTRPKDARGYPIPYAAFIDDNKRPHFTISDAQRVRECIKKRLCGLCGKKMERKMALIGGLSCFISPFGAFLDPPMHENCAQFAMLTCPYLAAPRYSKRIDEHLSKKAALPEDTMIVQSEMKDERPEYFGIGMCSRIMSVADGNGFRHVRNPDPWISISVWQKGQEVILTDQQTIDIVISELGMINV